MDKFSSKTNALCFGIVLLACQLGEKTAYGLDPQPLPVTKGVYRLPYADGTTVRFSNNHLNHPTMLNRVDMTGRPAGGFHTVVSAAAGWVRIIVENRFTNCPNACGSNNDCDGDGTATAAENNAAQTTACGSYSGPAASCCERDFEAGGGTCPNGGTCTGGPNNYVWMEHTNGEFMKLTHVRTGSVGVFGFGRFVGEFIPAGTPLGIEGDIGIASGQHTHVQVSFVNYVELPPDNAAEADPDSPPATIADWFTTGGFIVSDNVQDDVIFEDKDNDGLNDPDDDVNRQDRIAVFCQIGFPVVADENTAGPCDDDCTTDTSQLAGTIPAGSIFYRQVTDTMGNPNSDFVAAANSGVSIRAGDRITLSPGFHAEFDSFFSASIGACDTPGGSGE